jgi:Holliday junction resolvase RusA-like endonuclease
MSLHKSIRIEGQAIPWQRPRAAKGAKHFFTAANAKAWAQRVALEVKAALAAESFTPPMGLKFVLIVQTSGGIRKDGKPRLTKGDADNLAKLVADALQGIAYHDDNQGAFIGGAALPGGAMGQIIDLVWLMPDEARERVEEAVRAMLDSLTG